MNEIIDTKICLIWAHSHKYGTPIKDRIHNYLVLRVWETSLMTIVQHYTRK